MRLFVTAPLTLEPKLLLAKIQEAAPALQHLIMTEEFCRAYGNELRQLVKPENFHCFPLETSEFGECAAQVRLIEMTHLCNSVMVLRPRMPENSPLQPEPHINMSGLAKMVEKNYLNPLVIEV